MLRRNRGDPGDLGVDAAAGLFDWFQVKPRRYGLARRHAEDDDAAHQMSGCRRGGCLTFGPHRVADSHGGEDAPGQVGYAGEQLSPVAPDLLGATESAPGMDRRFIQVVLGETCDERAEVVGVRRVGEPCRCERSRTPSTWNQSVYTYFASKNAPYDRMFADGSQELARRFADADIPGEARGALRAVTRIFVEFAAQDQARYLLLFLRTIPGFQPSSESFGPCAPTTSSDPALSRTPCLRGIRWWRCSLPHLVVVFLCS